MTVAVMKTKAELALADTFETIASKLPGGPAVADARRTAIARFRDLGLPHRRVEEWKYSDVRAHVKDVPRAAIADTAAVTGADIDAALGALAALEADRVVFVNGRHRPELSLLTHASPVEVLVLADALAQAPAKVGEQLAKLHPDQNAIAALNTAYMTDGAIVRIGEGIRLERPLMLIFVAAGETPVTSTTRNLISVAASADVELVEVFATVTGAARDGHVNALTDVVIGEGAVVRHTKALLGRGEVHLANCAVAIGADAVYRGFNYTESPGFGRNQVNIAFAGERARLDFSGAFLARDQQHIDTTLVVDHTVPRCESRELFTGVLDGRARGVFQGKIIVRPDAQKTDGKQMAKALMLSPEAEFDSKPELEIYADDVICGHGATCTELDSELVFYCRSRGIPEAIARALLTEAFVGEALDRIECVPLREAIVERAALWLAGG
jgi:Fe-S cluster assembly protein SufD